jgi:hypothetical protein
VRLEQRQGQPNVLGTGGETWRIPAVFPPPLTVRRNRSGFEPRKDLRIA